MMVRSFAAKAHHNTNVSGCRCVCVMVDNLKLRNNGHTFMASTFIIAVALGGLEWPPSMERECNLLEDLITDVLLLICLRNAFGCASTHCT